MWSPLRHIPQLSHGQAKHRAMNDVGNQNMLATWKSGKRLFCELFPSKYYLCQSKRQTPYDSHKCTLNTQFEGLDYVKRISFQICFFWTVDQSCLVLDHFAIQRMLACTTNQSLCSERKVSSEKLKNWVTRARDYLKPEIHLHSYTYTHKSPKNEHHSHPQMLFQCNFFHFISLGLQCIWELSNMITAKIIHKLFSVCSVQSVHSLFLLWFQCLFLPWFPLFMFNICYFRLSYIRCRCPHSIRYVRRGMENICDGHWWVSEAVHIESNAWARIKLFTILQAYFSWSRMIWRITMVRTRWRESATRVRVCFIGVTMYDGTLNLQLIDFENGNNCWRLWSTNPRK